jgi:integrase
MPKLTDTKIRNTKPRAKSFKLYDSDGLFLIVKPTGGRWWRLKYFFQGKELLLSLGVYPEIDLATARARRDSAKAQLSRGVNPSADRQAEKAAQKDSAGRSYQAVSLQWLELTEKARKWTPDHVERVRRRQEVYFWPWLGKKPVADITEDQVRDCVLRISDKGLLDTPYRARAEVDSIFAFAKRRKWVQHNPCADLHGTDFLPKHKVRDHSAIKDPTEFGALLRALDTYPGGFVVRCALQVQSLCFTRPGELRLAIWEEFDLGNAEWRIPEQRMKTRQSHVVPLSKQALAVLRALHPVSGPTGFVFPQVRNASRPISNNTLNAALRTLGYTKLQASAHGFRSTARTLLNESGDWHSDAIERQLAHSEPNKVRGAYNSAQHMPERRKMMQAWADYLDQLRGGAARAAV